MAKKPEEVVLTPDLAPDPFLEKANAYAGAVEKNLRIIVGVAIAILVGSIASIMISQSGERKASARTPANTR